MIVGISLLSLITIVYLGICVSFYFFQDNFLFKRTQFPLDYKFHYEFPFEELFWKTNDGNSINGLWFKQTNPKGVILFFHGNSGHMGRSGNYYKRVRDKNFDVVLYDYRGYGKSTGKPSMKNLYTDALLVFDWVKKQYPDKPIVLHGLSLGSHIASFVASHYDVELLILETPFCDLPQVAQHQYPYLPVKLLMKYNLKTSRFLPQIKAQIHIFHGTRDRVVPLSEPLKIAKLSGASITIIDGANHKNLHDFLEYNIALEQLLKNV